MNRHYGCQHNRVTDDYQCYDCGAGLNPEELPAHLQGLSTAFVIEYPIPHGLANPDATVIKCKGS